MNKRVGLVMLGVAVLVGGAIGFTLWKNQEALLKLEGGITDIRLVELNDGATMVLVDFQAKNTSEVAFETIATEMVAVVEQGKVAPGAVFTKLQADPYFEFAKMKEHKPIFGPGDVVLPGSLLNHLIAARFYTPPDSLKDMGFRVDITSVQGTKISWFGKLVEGKFTEVTPEEAEKMVPIKVTKTVDKDGNVIEINGVPVAPGSDGSVPPGGVPVPGGEDVKVKDLKVQEIKKVK